jgi:hypothetical protein
MLNVPFTPKPSKQYLSSVASTTSCDLESNALTQYAVVTHTSFISASCVMHPCLCVSRSIRHQARNAIYASRASTLSRQTCNALHPMIRTCARVSLRSPTLSSRTLPILLQPVIRLHFSSTAWYKEDPRISTLGREIKDEYAVIRDQYGTSNHCDTSLLTDDLKKPRFVPSLTYNSSSDE